MRWSRLHHTKRCWHRPAPGTRIPKRCLCIFLLLLFAGILLSVLHRVDTVQSNNGIQIGATLPTARLQGSDGRWKETEDWIGRPLALILFKATCGACKQHIRQLATLYRGSPSLRAIQFVLVSVDPSLASLSSLEDHMAQAAGLPPFPVYADPTGHFVQKVRRMVVPTTYLVDKRGRVRYVRSGVTNAETEEAILRSLMPPEQKGLLED